MNRPSISWMTFAALAAATTTSCALIAGLDKDFQEGTSGAGGASASSAAGMVSSTGADVGTSVAASSADVGASVAATGAGGGSSVAATGAGGAYMGPPSCAGLAMNCGANMNEDCCAHPQVTGGMFNRDRDANTDKSDPLHPATVADFYLDRFEVTVGRFRRFVDAYPGNRPKAGAGANPKVTGSGWDVTWNNAMPLDKAALISAMKTKCGTDLTLQTWSDAADPNQDRRPINCNSWFVAFAFCAWDGGRLPSEVEWNYAAAGGSEQRIYPWGSADIDTYHASFNCLADGASDCSKSDILAVGSTPKGDGKWGHADLGGSMWEWMFDNWGFDYITPCNDCAVINTSTERVFRGGSWYQGGYALENNTRDTNDAGGHYTDVGFRCARDKP